MAFGPGLTLYAALLLPACDLGAHRQPRRGPGRGGRSRSTEVGLLGGQAAQGLAATRSRSAPPAATTAAPTRPSTSGAGLSTHPLPQVVVQQLQRRLGRHHRAAEVHQHHHAVAGVGRGDRRR